MSEEVDSPDFFGLDLLKFNGKNCGFNNLENNVNTRRKSENNEQSLYEEKSFVSNETKNNKKVLKSYSENFAAKKKQRRCGIPKRSKKVARRLRKTRKSIRQHKSCYRLVKKPWKTQSVREGSVLSTIVYNYTDKPETDNLMFPTNNQDSSRRRRQEHGQQQQSSVQRSQLESDTPGRVSDDVRDPPGQQSIYIPPGDNRLEQYRLSTFEHYPISSPTTRKSMAKSGFYFTGFFDRVKCFACARTVERWNNTDIPSDVRWHKESCPFPRREDCGNVPIRSLFGGINIGGASAQWNSRQNEQVLEQRDPTTGAITRVVRFPADLPERMRQTGGSFRIGPNNTVHIQNGPGTTRGRLPGVQQAPMPPNQWRMANVISSDHRRFLTNLHLNRELDRVASFARWPVGRPNVPPAALARTGFFYLGDMDRTQCFSCGGVLRNWTLEDDALDEHRSHFPACPMILGTEQRNVKVPEYPDTPDERATNFPCRFPSNPHMRNLAAREDTFDRRWPVGRTAATPAEISQAGFFFLGERDRVKCWYCNGGLQHWEYDDIPWVEHAKWFPTCQFLLQVKGQHFVYRHLSLSPHLARPIIACQDGSPLEGVNQPGRSHDIPPNVSRAQQPSPPPVIIDPQEEMRKKKERVEKEIKDSDVVKNVLAMGFSERIVRILLEEKIEANTEASSQEIYDSVAILLDDVVKKEEEIEREDQERRMNEQARSTEIAAQGAASMLFPSASSVYSTATTPMSSLGPSPGSGKYQVSLFDENEDEEAMDQDMYGSVAGSSSQETTKKQVAGNEEMTPSLREQLHKIEEERMCKVCFTNPAEMVFVPCGHICCCMQCTEAISHCPVCRVKIQRAIKTYLS
uniref:baculoviral IAP repeat-containing protein 3-like n=1 Tax=Styela clava TaxID=7725 RepID=UPI001939C7A4|nr:baculoviral IAP repeat-containing protein 3-like [Styela clava]